MTSFLSEGALWINLGWLYRSPEADAFRGRVLQAMRISVGLPPKGSEADHWTYHLAEWIDRKDRMLAAIERLRTED